MKRKAFTLVELSIVLVIIGLLVGGSFKVMKSMRERAKITEAKDSVLVAKNAILGYVMTYPNLPTSSEFQTDLSPVKNNQHPIFYAADTNLSTINNDICAYNTTSLKVVDNGVTPARVINDVAFVVAHEGADYNMQTALNGSNEVHIYGADDKVDDNTTPVNIVDFYDDIVQWVTLFELQQNVGCNDKPFRFLNDRLPHGEVNASYSATLYVENNVSDVTIDCTPPDDHNISFSDPDFSGTPDHSGTFLFDCNASETFPGSRIVSKKFVIMIDPNNSGGTGGGGFPWW